MPMVDDFKILIDMCKINHPKSDCGNEGTNGLGAAAGGVGAGCTGAEAGDNWAKVVVEYKRNCACNEYLMH
ncbi:hypothetical protein SESBI_11233 [Sesbania bispinosa]|nr:hypothetical protein SESBI_11233 [Sesbania bispinosa]